MVAPQQDAQEVARRIKAARMLAGHRSTKALADEIGEPGLSAGTINAMEQARRDVLPARDLDAIAKACGLPATWFYVDIAAAIRAMQPEVARLPPLTGELGRRVQDAQPDPQDQQPAETPREGDAPTGTDG